MDRGAWWATAHGVAKSWTRLSDKIAGRNINSLRYADDTTVMAESEEELKSLLMKVKSHSRVRIFATPWTVAYQAPLSMGFSRQLSWSGLPFPSPEDLPNPGIKPGSPAL